MVAALAFGCESDNRKAAKSGALLRIDLQSPDLFYVVYLRRVRRDIRRAAPSPHGAHQERFSSSIRDSHAVTERDENLVQAQRDEREPHKFELPSNCVDVRQVRGRVDRRNRPGITA